MIRTCLFPLRMNRVADGRGSQDERDLYMSATVPPPHEPNRSGKDAFRRVSNSFWKYGDAVERRWNASLPGSGGSMCESFEEFPSVP